MPLSEPPGSALKSRVLDYCAAHGADPGPGARVRLVTLPRLFGFHFNPVSFYFCFDAAGAPVCAIAEVTNTFREMKPYFIPLAACASRCGGAFRRRTPKHFYVSPFSPLDASFDFALAVPGGRFVARIDDFEGGRRTLHSLLTGRRAGLHDRRLAWFLIKYPLVTLKIAALIHWQAFRLWMKKVPVFRKADGAAGQRDLYRPHPTIARTPPA